MTAAGTIEAVRRQRRAARAAAIAFTLAIAGGVVAAAAYAAESGDTAIGLGLAAALTGTGFGLVAWSKSLGTDEWVVQAREPLEVSAAARAELHDELVDSGHLLGRRRALRWLFGGALASSMVAMIGPLGSLGPKPRGERARTSWRRGTRLVTAAGLPIPVVAASSGELATVFPAGAIGVDDSQVVLLRLPADRLSERTVAAGAPQGWVAYSKICTHAGCSVGLYGIDTRPPSLLDQLVCPCHQSVFDPLDGARPVGGPATRALPQLGLDVDAEGFLVARGDFDRPVGPLAWDEG